MFVLAVSDSSLDFAETSLTSDSIRENPAGGSGVFTFITARGRGGLVMRKQNSRTSGRGMPISQESEFRAHVSYLLCQCDNVELWPQFHIRPIFEMS